MKNLLQGVDVVSFLLLIAGGLNWGLIRFFDYNLLTAVFGYMSLSSRIIYGAVGLNRANLFLIHASLRCQIPWIKHNPCSRLELEAVQGEKHFPCAACPAGITAAALA